MGPARRPRQPWSAEEDERLRLLAAQGLSRHAIAVQLERDDRTVDLRAKAIQIELKVRPRAAVLGQASPRADDPSGRVKGIELVAPPARSGGPMPAGAAFARHGGGSCWLRESALNVFVFVGCYRLGKLARTGLTQLV
jgi:hypothetical protein